MTPPHQAIIQAPGFLIGIRCTADEITGIEYLEPGALRSPDTPLAHETVRQITAYLADPRFEFGLPLAPAGTHFQRRVWNAIAAIPCGQLWRSRRTDTQRRTRRRQCLRYQPLPDGRALPPRARRAAPTRRLRSWRWRLAAGDQALFAPA